MCDEARFFTNNIALLSNFKDDLVQAVRNAKVCGYGERRVLHEECNGVEGIDFIRRYAENNPEELLFVASEKSEFEHITSAGEVTLHWFSACLEREDMPQLRENTERSCMS